MESKDVATSRYASHLSLLALVREVAADAASPTDADECLRRLRAGLIRLGFSRAGIWVTDGTDSPIARGSWGTAGTEASSTSTA